MPIFLSPKFSIV